MPDKTARYRADSSLSYTLAILKLVEHSRKSPEDPRIEFGPMTLEGMITHGLVVTGPDLSEVGKLLSEVPGLVESDA